MVTYHHPGDGARLYARANPETETAMVQASLNEEMVNPNPRGYRPLNIQLPAAECSARLRYVKRRKNAENTNADGNKLLSVSKFLPSRTRAGP
jgi:hypothetical protein